jgi:hypothetical protein
MAEKSPADDRQLDPNTALSATLPVYAGGVIGAALRKLPYEDVAAILNDLQVQIDVQRQKLAVAPE